WPLARNRAWNSGARHPRPGDVGHLVGQVADAPGVVPMREFAVVTETLAGGFSTPSPKIRWSAARALRPMSNSLSPCPMDGAPRGRRRAAGAPPGPWGR